MKAEFILSRSAVHVLLAILITLLSCTSYAQIDPGDPTPPTAQPEFGVIAPEGDTPSTVPTEEDVSATPDTSDPESAEPVEISEDHAIILKYWDSRDSTDSTQEAKSLGEEGLDTLSEAAGRMVMGLSVVLAMILILYILVRRFGKHVPALSGMQLGQVVGQVHLTRAATLHYVKSGGRILVIGVNDGGVNLVAEFDEAAFSTTTLDWKEDGEFDPDSFVNELKEQSAVMRGEESTLHSEGMKDDEMSALRGDINRLQEYLQEENREQKD